ncbi:MAG: phosphotransferase [Gemmatimonas sp.]
MTTAAGTPSSRPLHEVPELLQFVPSQFRGSGTTVSRIAVGMSGAAVYLLEDGASKSVLKVTPGVDALSWARSVAISAAAADAGVAPRILHVSDEARGVLSEFIADRSFPALYGNPATRSSATDLLGRLIRRVHGIQPPRGSEPADAIVMLRNLWAQLTSEAATETIPTSVQEAVTRLLTEQVPASDCEAVLCHNDLNPTNLVFDGERLLMLDWQTAAINDPYYDLATVSVFLRMDADACVHLLHAYNRSFRGALPARFGYSRRLSATLSGCAFLMLSQRAGSDMSAEAASVENEASLADIYAELRSGATSLASPRTQRRMGLALINEGHKH